jgi:LPS export ABC transporter protein LptC
MMIYLFFKPLTIEKKDFIDMPLFEIQSFNMYEINRLGLKTILSGSSSKRYADRYTIDDMDYTDHTQKYIANMQSKYGTYTEKQVRLSGDIQYVREDGLTFKSEEAFYDKDTGSVYTEKEYVAFKGENILTGTSLNYNNLTNNIESKNIEATYQIQESK